MNDLVRIALLGIAVPLPIAAFCAWLAVVLARRDRLAASALLQILAVAVPMPIAFVLINGQPTEAWERLVSLTAIGAIAGVLACWQWGGVLRDLSVAVVLAALVTIALWPDVKPESSWLLRLSPGLASGVLAVILLHLAKALPGATVPLTLWVAAIGSGLAVVLMGQPSMGGAIAPVGAGLLILAIANRWMSPPSNTDHASDPSPGQPQISLIARTGVHPAVFVAAVPAIVSTTGIAWMHMKVTGSNYDLWLPMLASFATMAASVVLIPPVRSWKPAIRTIIAVAVVFVISFGAVALMATRDTSADSDDPSGNLPDFMSYPTD